ncbi:DUF3054 domain-containing protein [Arthrobacter psychrolactophilus]|uniref:DUF3054 domain-containing protein n=1 Tax=Arthrobacter psychrolactophilus TaxID=92442 RepID=A0A2V5JD80_9MICC|nr:DUF3054 domain-containing protein [Arthrobacter psychrolactophilus]PYI37107.1 DUF3054 domain-containing protein [Arthrobacter psychrolactophilus]
MTQSSSAPRPQHILYAATADIVLTLIFSVSGRSSHSEALTAGGVFLTAWPFLASLAIGWLICRLWRAPLRIWPQGVCLWLITVAGGMMLRILSGRTAEIPFVIVATIVLGVFLLGHRLIAGLITKRAARR